MIELKTHETIQRAIQQLEILRRDARDFDEDVRLQELILDMKRKLSGFPIAI